MKGIDLLIEQSKQKSGLDYIDVIVELCEKHNIDIYEIAEVLHPSIKSHLWYEARKRNLIQGERITTSLSDFFNE